jgi:hypothetical protein
MASAAYLQLVYMLDCAAGAGAGSSWAGLTADSSERQLCYDSWMRRLAGRQLAVGANIA